MNCDQKLTNCAGCHRRGHLNVEREHDVAPSVFRVSVDLTCLALRWRRCEGQTELALPTAGHCFHPGLPLCSQPGAVCRRGFTSAASRLPLSWNDMRQGHVRNWEGLVATRRYQSLVGDHSVQSRLRMPETIAGVRDAQPSLISPTLVVE